MTESKWLAYTDPAPMLEFLKETASDRKLLLSAAACLHRCLHLLPDEQSRKAVDAIESYADGLLTRRRVDTLRNKIVKAHNISSEPRRWTADHSALRGLAYALFTADRDMIVGGAEWSADALATEKYPGSKQRGSSGYRRFSTAILVQVLREIFGNPFRHTAIAQAILNWGDHAVVKLGESVYDERAFDRLPIVADAMEDAGCTDADILDHLRGPGPHVRGCFALELILGKK